MTGRIIEDQSLRERSPVFRDRFDAGKRLAEKLRTEVSRDDTVILAIPNGGVPIAHEIANETDIPMDVVIVRKVQIPWNTEAGFGAVTWNDEVTLNGNLVARLGLTEKEVMESVAKTRRIILERLQKFRGNRPMPDLKGKTVVLVDDGLASGVTMLATTRAVEKMNAGKIIVAVPTGSLGAVEALSHEVDEIVCLNIRSRPVFAVADAYERWYDVADEEVMETLKESKLNGLTSPP